jgi:hypothetical protein
MRSSPEKQEVDIFCPVGVSGWIKNIQPVAVAVTHIDHTENRDLSFFMDCGYSMKPCSRDMVTVRGHTVDAEGADERGQARREGVSHENYSFYF